MLPEVRTDILFVLSQAIEALKGQDGMKLAELSNHTIHNASIFQDEDSIAVAVVVYALSKIFEREHGSLDAIMLRSVQSAEQGLKEGNLGKYKQSVREMTSAISKVDTKLKLYVEEVMNQAQIRKGSKIYEHGISLARASEMLGISQWDLMNYVGKTQIIDRSEKARRAIARLNFSRRLFGL